MDTENRFLKVFPHEPALALLKRYSPDHRGLIVNLFEPAAAVAIGLTLLQKDPEDLAVTATGLRALEALFAEKSHAQLETLFTGAAEKLAGQIGLTAPCHTGYLTGYAQELAARVDVLRDCGGLSGIFLPVT